MASFLSSKNTRSDGYGGALNGRARLPLEVFAAVRERVGRDYPEGHFNLDKKIPYLNSNVEPIVGWVENTLESFLKKHNSKIKFVHMDLDIYTSSKFTLEKIKPYLTNNSYIIFDDFFNYIGWESGEYKALNEVFDENEFEYLGFNLGGHNQSLFGSNNCVVKIKK